LNTYRQRIGMHALRARRTSAKSCSTCKVSSESWNYVDMADEYMIRTCRTCLRFTSFSARVGVLVLILYTSLAVMSIAQPCSPIQNLHNLSTHILLDGDVESNPGPSNSEKSETHLAGEHSDLRQTSVERESLESIWERRFAELESRMEKRIERMETELEKQKDILKSISGACEHGCKNLSESQEVLRGEIDTLGSNLDFLASDVQNQMRMSEDQVDKQEGLVKRNNIKLFGLYEEDHEPYWKCLQKVLQLFREAVPGVQWSEKDIARVQRLGAPRVNDQSRPRPLIVEMTTFLDKLTLLRYGRNGLRNRGVRIASELTNRQAKTLNDLREQGHQAYYRNNKLWFRDARQDFRSNDRRKAMNQRRDLRKKHHSFDQGAVGREHYGLDRNHGFPESRKLSAQQHGRNSLLQDQSGTWEHPDSYSRRQHCQLGSAPSDRGHCTSSVPHWQPEADHMGTSENADSSLIGDPPSSDYPHHHNREPSHDKVDDTQDVWLTIRTELSRNNPKQPPEDRRLECSTVQSSRGSILDEQEHAPHQWTAEPSSFSESTASDCAQESALRSEENTAHDKHLSADAALKPVHEEQADGAVGPTPQENRSTRESRKNSQKSILDWLNRNPVQSDVGITPHRNGASSSEPAKTHRQRATNEPLNSLPVWHGRLRHIPNEGAGSSDQQL